MALKCAEDRGEKCKKDSTKTETDGVIPFKYINYLLTICVILNTSSTLTFWLAGNWIKPKFIFILNAKLRHHFLCFPCYSIGL